MVTGLSRRMTASTDLRRCAGTHARVPGFGAYPGKAATNCRCVRRCRATRPTYPLQPCGAVFGQLMSSHKVPLFVGCRSTCLTLAVPQGAVGVDGNCDTGVVVSHSATLVT